MVYVQYNIFVKYDDCDMYSTKYVNIMYKTYRVIHGRAEILSFSLSEVLSGTWEVWSNQFYEEKKLKQVSIVIPESNDGMNNVLTQIIGEKLGNLADVPKMTERRLPLSTFIALIKRHFSLNVRMSICWMLSSCLKPAYSSRFALNLFLYHLVYFCCS